MRVAIFNHSDETVGFCPEGVPGNEWLFEKYPVVEMTTEEVEELKSTFLDFQRAQNKIGVLFARKCGMEDVSFIETSDYFISFRDRSVGSPKQLCAKESSDKRS